jgi:hypothetical protein
MLNLSDKELDRMARQAADEYDPGSFKGPEQWNKLQAGLDNELGKVRFNPFRAIRRMPFYYAPAVLLLAAVAYYLIRHSSSGSPPPSVVKAMPRLPTQAPDESVNTKNLPYKPTSTPDQQQRTNNPGNKSPNLKNPERPADSGNAEEVRQHGEVADDQTGAKPLADHRGQANAVGREANKSGDPEQLVAGTKVKMGSGRGRLTSQGEAERNQDVTGRNHGEAERNQDVTGKNQGTGRKHGEAGAAPGALETNNSVTANGHNSVGKELEHSTIRAQASHAGKPVVDDAGLRGIALTKAGSRPGPITPGKSPSPSMRINRSLEIGLVVAPDFASVNSLAGDRPGSSFGLSLDYQFVNKLYLSTGILFSRKNYTATAQDYHVPYDYYIRNNMHNVDFVKGTFNLIEIPVNLRYDFSVAGNTAFFASGGLSSYLLTGENCNYYFDLFGREASRGFNYKGGGAHLLSAVNLSIGVETGLSNELSLLISPYVKIPTGGLGFGGIDVNSMGINFGIKYAPVLRRSRH